MGEEYRQQEPPSAGVPVDLTSYARRRLFECFRHHPVPVFSLSSQIDISGYAEFIEQRGLRFYTTLCCLISRAINDSPCFRHRIVEGVLLEYPRVHPSINVALDEESFCFADALYCGSFTDDYASLRTAFEVARRHPNQEFRGGLDDRFFLTHLPWLSFTGIQHPYTPEYASIPMISTGRSFRREGADLLPIAVQAHHALVDGVHVARLLERLSSLCRDPRQVVG
ncbi:MAG: CatA-like O-acetyltransferase [Prochlorococcaceae cyanobacterium]|jgi:chloramphenicol O-acetyltransferase type A